MGAFVPYSGLHLFSVGICALVIACLAAAGRALGASRQASVRRLLGMFAILYWVSYNVWWNWRGVDLATGLPLQICDINGLIAPLALLTLNRWLRAVLYFWAMALTTQAFIQPALRAGPGELLFWWFWAQHTIILGYAVFDLTVLGFRPDWHDLGRAYAAGAAYLAVIIPVDIALNADYGYLGNLPPDQIPPFVASLGPWPARAIVLVVVAAVAMAVVALPWQMWKRRTASKPRAIRIEQPQPGGEATPTFG